MRIFNIFCSKPSKAKSKNVQRAHTKRAEDSNADSSCSPTPSSSRSPDCQLFVDPSPTLANNDSVKQNSKSVSKAAAAAHTEKSHIPSGMFSIQFLYKNPLGRAIMQDHISQRMQQSGTIVKAKNCDDVREDAQLAQYVHSIPNALRYKGTLLQGYLVYPRVLAKIEQFQVRPDDIWVCTYPKSGTTWTEEILSLIVNDGDTDKTSKTLLAERVPHFEVGKPFGHMKWLNNIQASPRILATHLNTDCIPNQLKEAKAKIIYVVRNPKDTAVSYFHHHKMSSFLGNYSGTWDKYLQLFESGKLVYGDWFEHVRGFWQMAQTHPDQVLFISYEELKINLRGTIEMIGNFIGRPLSAATADKIAQQCTFEKMKNNAMVNREVLPLPDLFDMSNTKFMRKGIIGDWQSQFTPQQSQRFDEIFMPKLASIGLELAFDTEQALRMFQQCCRVLRSTAVSASATFVPVDHASVTSDLGSSGSSDDEESNHADGSGDHQERASSSSSVSSTCGNSMGSFENETSGTPYCTDSSLHAHHKPTMTVQKAC